MTFPSTRGGDRIAVITRNDTVRVWDAANLGVALLSSSTGAISRAAFFPDGQVLAVAGSRGVLLFDAYTLAELSRVETTGNNVQNLAVRGNGSEVVTVASEGPVRIWDTSSGSVISSLAPQKTGLMDYVYG